MTYRPVFAFPAGDPGNKPRSPQKHGDSKLGRLTGFVLAKRLIGESVELSGRNVSFKFPIPNLSVEFDKPLPKFSQFVRRKVLNLTLKDFDFAYWARRCRDTPQRLWYVPRDNKQISKAPAP